MNKPTGFIAVCGYCDNVLGALDFDRTDRAETSKIIGEWLMNGYTVVPMKQRTWEVQIKSCDCNE